MSSKAEVRSVPESELRVWGATIRDAQAPLLTRWRAMLGLRYAREALATDLLAAYVTEVVPPHPAANALLQHEAAYCLGQRGDPSAVLPLEKALREVKHEPIVRHEAAEALAALCGKPGVDIDYVKAILEEFVKCDIVAVSETCEIGLSRIDWLRRKDTLPSDLAADRAEAQFPNTVDPSPALPLAASSPGSTPSKQLSIAELRAIMADASAPLPKRYQALFSLRNISLDNGYDNDELIEVLKEALAAPGSALLRHEVAFILGQLSITKTGDALVRCLLDPSEAPMVRHEAAMALGEVAGEVELTEARGDFSSSRGKQALEKMCSDPEPVVRDSCALALDIADYVASNERFQFAEIPK